ncbi:DAK2 domain-containing protein [Brachybacterium sacelli]|uniref:Dihydroxyacetone kinase n=1 Tax=Brachybacterium sacelli TaxID=173364 RepID=A0ABS4WXY2_9MICO|nr:DAK2 domain-containing protein [Brachybacterium sacelli]MBP2380951.1 dihydroxyacetone kinase [Brachybacterium sacelli]
MTTTSTLPDDFGRAFVTRVREALSGSADALGDLDRRAGDGDFGTNIRTAMTLLKKNVEDDDPDGYREWLTALYMAWLGVGGTSGPLFGMFFRDLAKAADAQSPGTGGGDPASEQGGPTPAQFGDALAAGQATVQKYGEAKVGDKTMVDALDPAVAALREALEAGKDAAAAFGAAEQAAVDAARSTAETTARRGRASYVGEASEGVIDPGAAAMALVIGASRAAAEGTETVETSWIA